MDALKQLQDLLRELFQLDFADLDFGLYRLLHIKRNEIEAFLTEQLPSRCKEAFQGLATEENTNIEKELSALAKRICDEIADDAILENGELNPDYRKTKVKAARSLIKEYEANRKKLQITQVSEAHQTEVFNHLYAFFSRYYESGDFIPRRRYGARETYAVPYNGEEVFFHWANKDQHYVKTAQNFRDYAFSADTVGGSYRVRFLLTEANLPQGNTKGDTRYFFPVPEQATFNQDDKELRLPFHYRLPTEQEVIAHGKNSKFQESVLQNSLPKIMQTVPDSLLQAALGDLLEQHDDQQITVLLKRLRHFCRRNTTDYFIHKDLKGFLTQELEFYLKDQVLHLADLDGDVEGRIRTIRVIRKLGEEIILFLSQLEEVEKRLFEKRKFVLHTDYLVPIKEVPEELWVEVIKNQSQLQAWKELFAIDPEVNLFNQKGKVNKHFLQQHPTLVVNTAFFDQDFKDRLLSSFDDLDEVTDGLLIHSENYQALRLLERKYANRVKCIYIDPPYNTGSDEFIYRDNYQHSCWLEMMEDRLLLARQTLSHDGLISISIDDIEVPRLIILLRKLFGDQQQIATLVWDRNRKNDATFFSVGHEYMTVFARDREFLKAKVGQLREIKPGVEEARRKFTQLRRSHRDNWLAIEEEWSSYIKGLKDYEMKGVLSKYPKMGPRGPFRDDGNINWPGPGGPRYTILHPKTQRPVKIPKSGWRYPTEERFWEEYSKENISFGPDETSVPGVMYYLFESTEQVMGSVFWSYAQTALDEFVHLFGDRVFENPKNWRDIARVSSYLTSQTDTILDFFAGSGTTGHAVINLNRDDGGRRRFILVEMAGYFDTVLLPRIERITYTPEWKEGKPYRLPSNEEIERTPRLVKILKLESYEDALHNLSTEETRSRVKAKERAYKRAVGDSEYRLSYLVRLPLESNASLLNLAALEHPFDYRMEVLTDSGPREEKVDLIETFNFLLGIHVERLETWTNDKDSRTYRVVKARDRNDQRTLIIWRDMKDLDPAVERRFLEPKIKSEGLFNEILINGDTATPGIKSLDGTFKRLVEGV